MKAWQSPIGTLRDVCHSDPTLSYHPAIAIYYDTEVPDTAVNGAMLVNGVWVNPTPPAEPTEADIAASQAAVLVAVKSAKWEAIKTERERRTQDGGYYVATHWYHSDQFSRIQQIGLVMLGTNIPVGTMWKVLDNGLVEMTQALAGQIFSAAAANDIAIFNAAQAHKTAMEASVNPADYDFSQGWPVMYGEAL